MLTLHCIGPVKLSGDQTSDCLAFTDIALDLMPTQSHQAAVCQQLVTRRPRIPPAGP
ncbi:hypothetical protein ACQEU3_38640 [Spirillospora sp. CA-253888]